MTNRKEELTICRILKLTQKLEIVIEIYSVIKYQIVETDA